MNTKAMSRVALVALITVASLIIISLLAGCQFNTVRSSSMAPALNVGDVVITAPTDIRDIKVNDVISFRSPSNGVLICHRVIYINESAGYLLTKGDANEDPDWFTVPFGNVVGKVVGQIPFLGYVISFLSSLYGMGTTIMWIAIALLCDDVFKKAKEQDRTGGMA